MHDDRKSQPNTFPFLSFMPAVIIGHPVGDPESLDFYDDVLLTTRFDLWHENDPGIEYKLKVSSRRQDRALRCHLDQIMIS